MTFCVSRSQLLVSFVNGTEAMSYDDFLTLLDSALPDIPRVGKDDKDMGPVPQKIPESVLEKVMLEHGRNKCVDCRADNPGAHVGMRVCACAWVHLCVCVGACE